ncbi:MAG TPA: cell division topological specificity factor MinE [Candidatus Cybelea sp.]|jgi:cell division topological specificity factor|nr:cell division topological specificity factor MinE [Candidatus Cybelea sp.]
MIEFLRKLFGQSGSSATAKERLRFVLMTDHLELAPELIEAMKRDLVDVISRHVEVDRDKIEVNFERQDSALAMLANIPILSINRPNGSPTLVPAESVRPPIAANGAPPPRVRKRRKRSTKKAAGTGSAPAPASAAAN